MACREVVVVSGCRSPATLCKVWPHWLREKDARRGARVSDTRLAGDWDSLAGHEGSVPFQPLLSDEIPNGFNDCRDLGREVSDTFVIDDVTSD